MTKRTNLCLLALCLVTAFALLLVCPLNQSSRAQEQQRIFKPGEMVDTGGGMTAKILQCRGAGDNEECEIQYYRGDTRESTPRWENTIFLRRAEERILNNKNKQAAEQPETENGDKTKPQAAPFPPPNDTDTNEKTADCSFIAPPGDTSTTAKPSEQLFKRKIFDRYNMLANGTGSAPLKVGVTFLTFQVSKPFTNVVRVDPARGALRINDAAPVNATVYPIKSEHVVCEQYRDGTQRSRVENKYACFKNRDSEWVCGADGIPKITQLN